MIEGYRTAFSQQDADGLPVWLAPIRQAGLDRFVTAGFPSSKDEEWRFTPLGALPRTGFAPAQAPAHPISRADLEPHLFGQGGWPALVFVNGRFAPELSQLPPAADGVVTLPLARALVSQPGLVEPHLGRHAGPEATPFTALNAAFIQDGAFIRVPAGAELKDPILLLFVTTAEAAGQVTHPRNLIVVEPGARVSLVESYVGLDQDTTSFTNAVTEVVVEEGAWVEHTRIQRESEAAYHIGYSHVHQAAGSHYRSFTLAMGGLVSRHNLHTRLNAPETEALLYGLSIAHRDQLVDNHTAIYHDQPNCRSWEVYKAILDDRSRGVFNGKVFVTPEAQKPDAKQTSRTLLLSDHARVNAKPQLEIFADDVKCTHGATVGYLDPMPQFYFQSRGIPADRAQRLLTYAFAAEVLGEVTVDAVREALDLVVRTRLGISEGA
ncbi:MAG: Fe-S cluster assembly protein SufD [Gemmatimonadota bacterium]